MEVFRIDYWERLGCAIDEHGTRCTSQIGALEDQYMFLIILRGQVRQDQELGEHPRYPPRNRTNMSTAEQSRPERQRYAGDQKIRRYHVASVSLHRF